MPLNRGRRSVDSEPGKGSLIRMATSTYGYVHVRSTGLTWFILAFRPCRFKFYLCFPMKEDTVARMDRLEDMFHLVIQKKDSEIEGFKKTVNEMKLKIADLEFSLENANDRFEGVQLGE